MEPDSPARSQSLVPGHTSPSFTAESSLHQGQPCCQRSPTSLISDRDRAGGSPEPRRAGGEKGRSRGKPQTPAERARLLLPRAHREEARGAQRVGNDPGNLGSPPGSVFSTQLPPGAQGNFLLGSFVPCWFVPSWFVSCWFFGGHFCEVIPGSADGKQTQTDPPHGWGRQGTSISPGVPPRARKEAAANCRAGN